MFDYLCATHCGEQITESKNENNYSAVCVCGTAVGVKMCDDKALGGAIGNEL